MPTDTTAEPAELEPTVLDTEPSFTPGDQVDSKAASAPKAVDRTAPSR